MRKTLTLGTLVALLLSGVAVAEENWDAGVAALKARKYADAAAAFGRYVEVMPDTYQGHQLLGQALLMDGQASKAVPHLQKANELKSGDANIQLALGRALAASGKARDACAILGKINASGLPKQNQTVLYQLRARANCGGDSTADLKKVAEAKNDANSWAAYGSALLNQNQVAQSIAAFDKAIALAPNDARVRKSQLSVLVRQARTSRGAAKDSAYSKAIASAKKLVQLDGSYNNLLTLGEVQMGSGNYTGSITTLSGAAAKNSGAWLPQYYIGQAHTANGSFNDAVAPLDRALSLASGDDQRKVHKQLGFVYEKMKDYPKSIDHYQKGGDSRAATRVRENMEIAKQNLQADEHNQRISELEAQQEQLKKELQALPGGAPPPRR